MTTEQDQSLTIDAVIRSFQMADLQLRAAAEKIDSLTVHEATAARAASGLEASATSVASLAASADDAVRQLRSALDLASQSLKAGAAILDSAVLTDLQSRMAATETLLKNMDERGNAQQAVLVSDIAGVNTAVRSVEAKLAADLEATRGELADLIHSSAEQSADLKELAEGVSRVSGLSRRLTLMVGGVLAVEIVGFVVLLMR